MLEEDAFRKAYETIIFGRAAVWSGKKLSDKTGAEPVQGLVSESTTSEGRQANDMAHFVFEQAWLKGKTPTLQGSTMKRPLPKN